MDMDLYLHMLQLSKPFYGTVITVAAIIAPIENTVILAVLANKKQRQSASNKLLISLVVSDMLYGYIGFTVSPFIEFNTDALHHMGQRFLYVTQFVIILLVNSSTLSILCLSYNRYLVLTRFSENRHSITETSTKIVAMFAWVASIPLTLTGFLLWSLVVAVTFLFYGGCFAALCTFYFYITGAMRKSTRQILDYHSQQRGGPSEGTIHHSSNPQPQEHRIKVRQSRLAKRVRLILSLYILCYMTSSVFTGTSIFLDIFLKIRFTNHGLFFCVAKILLYIDSCLNPIIYARKVKKYTGWSRNEYVDARLDLVVKSVKTTM